ncbi:MAG: insulinase family protein [Eggerthellaceae bacterium]|jgi:Zn-dependent M16 (insulinase) family peptidase
MTRSPGDKIHGFELISEEDLPEIDGKAYVYKHEASHARLLYLANDDSNKAFSIAFKTPPKDDTGVFHILEHSVLCGSDKFPVKEPFVNLLKSSMQTFLNAMTFPDKTMYPVASTNEQDLLNLMDVYLDAVLHPQIYHKRSIFEQEGWHFELANDTALESSDSTSRDGQEKTDKQAGQLSLNGVVFNEMKGALSDPSSVLFDCLQTALFPDTTYRYESGGTPEAIPTLSYENYLDEHRRHYRLDNSYLFVYGDVHIEKILAFLDLRYLGPEAAIQPAQADFSPRTISYQEPVENLNVVHHMVTAEENACLGLGYVVGEAHEHTRMIAVDILLDALLGSNEAPLTRALLDAKIADDIQFYLATSMRQPFVLIQAMGLHEDAAERFLPTFEEAVQEILEKGLDEDLIEASLSHAEFVMREGDFGVADGVVYAMTSLKDWLYDDNQVGAYLHYDADFADLRKKLSSNYFADLLRSIFLENHHRAFVQVLPASPETQPQKNPVLVEAEKNLTVSKEQEIKEDLAELRRLQMEPDSPEDLAKLPHLGISDIQDMPKEPESELIQTTPITCLRHGAHKHGLAYTYRYYDAAGVRFEDLPYLRILGIVLSHLATQKHSASEIDTLVQGKLGNLVCMPEVFEDKNDAQTFYPRFTVGASSLSENIASAASLPIEIITETDFSDTEKIKDLLQQKKIAMEQAFINSGHASAMRRASSYYLPVSLVSEQLYGVDFYRFLKDLLAHYEERKVLLVEKLEDLSRLIFSDAACLLSFSGSDEDFDRFWDAGALCQNNKRSEDLLRVPEPQILHEAFIIPSDISFSALGYDRRTFNPQYTGAWKVASRALSFDYLWNEIRVKGGAYGAGFQAQPTGDLRFYTYRDPHFDESIERMRNAPSWLAEFKPDKQTFEGYVVSSVAGFDTPLKTRELIRREDQFFITHRPENDRLITRNEIRNATIPEIQSLSETLAAAINEDAYCVFGNEKILKNSHLDLHLINLMGE